MKRDCYYRQIAMQKGSIAAVCDDSVRRVFVVGLTRWQREEELSGFSRKADALSDSNLRHQIAQQIGITYSSTGRIARKGT